MKKEWIAMIAVIMVAALLPETEWLEVKVTDYQIFPGGSVVILTIEKNPLPSAKGLVHCIARAEVQYRNVTMTAYDSTATLYPNELELHVNGLTLQRQCEKIGILGVGDLCDSTRVWSIQPKERKR